MERVTGGANNMHPPRGGGGDQPERCRSSNDVMGPYNRPLSRFRIFSVSAPSLVGAYSLQPPNAHAIFLHIDLLCNDTRSVIGVA